MKRLKNKIREENENLLEEGRDFLENTLLPMAEPDRMAAMPKSRFKKAAVPLICVLLCCVTAIVCSLIFSTRPVDPFGNGYITNICDLTEVNGELEKTQFADGFQTILKTYRKTDGKSVYFTLKEERKSSQNIMTSTIKAVIDRSYQEGQTEIYKERFDLCGFPVVYNKEISSLDDENAVYIAEIQAYMDTGAEQFYIEYKEWAIGETNGFQSYLETVIIAKGNNNDFKFQ